MLVDALFDVTRRTRSHLQMPADGIIFDVLL
jgi:hypothetical protein